MIEDKEIQTYSPMQTGFTIFRIKRGKEKRAAEWMDLLLKRRNECIDTLDREAMHYESIFRTQFEGRLFLAWFSVQGDIHEDVNESEHEIDKLHCAFFDECVEVDTWRPVEMEHVVSFVPPEIERVIAEQDQQSQLRLTKNNNK